MSIAVSGNVFEGLFQRSLKPTGDFAEALRQAGYDLSHPKHSYPLAVWEQCLAVAAARVCAGMTQPEAHRHLGHHIAEGYKRTLVGGVLLAMVPHLSPETVLERLPAWMSNGMAEGTTLDIVERGIRCWVLRMRHVPGATQMPDFTAGAFEGMFAGVRSLRVEVMGPVEGGYQLRVTW